MTSGYLPQRLEIGLPKSRPHTRGYCRAIHGAPECPSGGCFRGMWCGKHNIIFSFIKRKILQSVTIIMKLGGIILNEQTRNNNHHLSSARWSLEHLKQRPQGVCWGAERWSSCAKTMDLVRVMPKVLPSSSCCKLAPHTCWTVLYHCVRYCVTSSTLDSLERC